MPVLMFDERFREPILKGTKTQAVIISGLSFDGYERIDTASVLTLAMWKYPPSFHNRTVLDEALCVSVKKFQAGLTHKGKLYIRVDGWLLKDQDREAFAIREGFDSFESFERYFLEQHEVFPLLGRVVEWR